MADAISSGQPAEKKAKLVDPAWSADWEAAKSRYDQAEQELKQLLKEADPNQHLVQHLQEAMRNAQKDKELLLRMQSQQPEEQQGLRDMIREEFNAFAGQIPAKRVAPIISVRMDVPPDFRVNEHEGSVQSHAISVSTVGKAEGVTSFQRQAVVGEILPMPFDLPAEAMPRQFNDLKDLQTFIHQRHDLQYKFGLKIVENDPKFNMCARVQDAHNNYTVLKARVDAVLLPSPEFAMNQDLEPAVVLEKAILLIEIESGKKGMENAETQLLCALRVLAAERGTQMLYGVVIDHSFTKARLVRFCKEVCEADGQFHPSMLCEVGHKVLTKP